MGNHPPDSEGPQAFELTDKDVHIRNLNAKIRSLEMQRDLAQRDASLLRRSWAFRLGRVFISPASMVKRLFERRRHEALHHQPPPALDWTEARARYEAMTDPPTISVVMPVYDTPARLLRAAVASVEGQIYREWELCIADDGSASTETRQALSEIEARGDERIRITRLSKTGGIARASNAAGELAGGEFLALLDHDDTLEPGALLAMALRIAEVPDADLLYSDEDKIDSNGRFCQPFHKPNYSPEWLLSANYICHLTVIRTSVFHRVGGFREGFDGSQDWDLVLRVAEVARQIEHLPQVLYHWRMIPGSTAAEVDAKGGLWRESSRRVLRSAIERRKLAARVEDGAVASSYRVRYEVDPSQRVTIIIPTKDRVDLLRPCIESIRAHTEHPSYEILVVCNNCEEQSTFEYLESLSGCRDLSYIVHDAPFNFSELNNLAVRETSAPYLCFMNNDIELISDGWLTSMLEHAQRAPIGAVGAKLLYADDTIQHAGVVLGIGGIAGHLHRRMPADQPGYFSMASVVRDSSAVTGACLLTRRDVFEEVRGFGEELEVAFNDVDLCMKIREAGYRIVYTPYAMAYHPESASRGPDDTPAAAPRFRRAIATMVMKWGERLREDPFYNPNLTLLREDCTPFTIEDRLRFEEHVAVQQCQLEEVKLPAPIAHRSRGVSFPGRRASTSPATGRTHSRSSADGPRGSRLAKAAAAPNSR